MHHTTACPWTTRLDDGSVLVGVPPYQAMRLTNSAALIRAAMWADRIGRTDTRDVLAAEATAMRWTESGRA